MSKGFVNEDRDEDLPRRQFDLPQPEEPGFDAAAARALLEAARDGETAAAEAATGYYWGEPKLQPHVKKILAEAVKAKDDRLEQVARHFLE